MISEKTKLPAPHTSKTLKELVKVKIVNCINPKDRKGKVYELTELGEMFLGKYLSVIDELK